MAVCACTAGIDMTQEALKLALEALEKNAEYGDYDFDHQL
jgi:fructose-specific phosphotransferase system component IIB